MSRKIKYTNPPRIKVRVKKGPRLWEITYYTISTLSPQTKSGAQAKAKILRQSGEKARIRRFKDGHYVFSSGTRGFL